MSVRERSRMATSKRKLFKNLFCKINFRQVAAYLEKDFQLRKQRFFSSDLKVHKFY